MTKKTKKLIARIEDATGGKVAFETADGLEVAAELQSRASDISNSVSLVGTCGCRNEYRAVKALAHEVRRRGRAMAKV
jgi:hypothetical protein